MHPFWLWPNLLSLDAPLIAVLWLHLIAVSGQIRISPIVTLALALVVWLIYVADRLLDGSRADPLAALPARHQFYRAHRKLWFSLLVSGLALTCCICLDLDPRTLLFGTLLILVVAGYFAAVHRARFRFPKEAAVAVVFAIGTFFPAWIHAQGWTGAMTVSLILFIAICWLNTTLIEYAEWAGLRQRGSAKPHASTLIGGNHLLQIGTSVAIIAFVMAQLRMTQAEHLILLAVSISALALAGLGFCWQKFSMNMVRVLADATLLTPVVVLVFLHR